MPGPARRFCASARRVHRASFSDARRPMPCPGAACRPFLPVSPPPSPISSPWLIPPIPPIIGFSPSGWHTPPIQSAGWTMRRSCIYRAMEQEVRLPEHGSRRLACEVAEGLQRRQFRSSGRVGPGTGPFFGGARGPGKPEVAAMVSAISSIEGISLIGARGRHQARFRHGVRLRAAPAGSPGSRAAPFPAGYRRPVVSASSLVRAVAASLLVSAVSRKEPFMARARTGWECPR
jgi:hypothetical protein